MEIKTNSLISLLNLASNTGKVVNKEVLLDFKKDKITALAASNGREAVIYGEIYGLFEEIGEIGIGDLPLLINLVEDYNEKTIEITKKDNKLIFDSEKDKLKISYILKNPQYLLVNNRNFNFNLNKFNELYEKAKGNEFTLNETNIKKIVKYFTSIKTNALELIGKDNLLKLVVSSNDNEIVSEIALETKIMPISIRLSEQFIEIIKNLKKATVSTYNLQPVSIVAGEDNEYKVNYLLAQLSTKK